MSGKFDCFRYVSNCLYNSCSSHVIIMSFMTIFVGMAARLFHKLKLLDKAEELYIGALVLDPEVQCAFILRFDYFFP